MRVVLLSILSVLPFASLAIEPYTCRNGAFPTYTELGTAEIVASKGVRVHAQNDTEGCPSQTQDCVEKGYLVNGDKVLTAHPAEGWVCVYYPGKKNDYTGWVRQESLKAMPLSANSDLEAWSGRWERAGGTGSLTIHATSAGTLKVDGKALWYGGKTSSGDQVVHEGQVSGATRPTANKVVITEGDGDSACVVELELVGAYLIGTDNGHCGGVNVRFNGVYQRVRRQPA